MFRWAVGEELLSVTAYERLRAVPGLKKGQTPAREAEKVGPAEPPAGLNPKYTRHSYRIAVQWACVRAGVPVWSPNHLRHTRATQIRAAFGSIGGEGRARPHGHPGDGDLRRA